MLSSTTADPNITLFRMIQRKTSCTNYKELGTLSGKAKLGGPWDIDPRSDWYCSSNYGNSNCGNQRGALQEHILVNRIMEC